jgi:hypothetical protein
MKTKALKTFINTQGYFQSPPRVSGEIHAACFMFHVSYEYIKFIDEKRVLMFSSRISLLKLHENSPQWMFEAFKEDKLRGKEIPIKEENWADGTFAFTFTKFIPYNGITMESICFDGNLQTDVYGDLLLLVVGKSMVLNADLNEVYSYAALKNSSHQHGT